MIQQLHGHQCPLQPGAVRMPGRFSLLQGRHLGQQLAWQQPKPVRRRQGQEAHLTVQAVSMPRNWHVFKMNIKYSLVNLQDQFWALPFVAAAVQRYHQIQRPVSHAVLSVLSVVSAWWQNLLYDYSTFCTEENVREWKWRRRHEQEWDLWRRILLAMLGVAVTMIWEAIVPTSIFLALVPPLFLSWVLYKNWLLSPFILGLIIMLPLKFPPYGPWRWL